METSNAITISATRTSLEDDWRFAELIAATWVEPELSVRYAENPDVVLAEFGIFLAPGERAPELPVAAELDMLVDDFERLPETGPFMGSSLGQCSAKPVRPTKPKNRPTPEAVAA